MNRGIMIDIGDGDYVESAEQTFCPECGELVDYGDVCCGIKIEKN